MNLRVLAALALISHAVSVAAQTPAAQRAIVVIQRLGEANGQALACGAKEAISRAKELMLRHAPRTSTYGTAFDQSTQRGYLGQLKGNAPCPSEAELAVRLESIAQALREALPQGQ